jgi:hypothetical protein
MMTDPAPATKPEILHLVEQQIETFRRDGPMTDFQLEEYRARSAKITRLYQELDHIARARALPRFARAATCCSRLQSVTQPAA